MSAPALARELAVLDRLVYKNRAQHRGSRHFQRLLEVGTDLRFLFRQWGHSRPHTKA